MLVVVTEPAEDNTCTERERALAGSVVGQSWGGLERTVRRVDLLDAAQRLDDGTHGLER